MTGHGVGESRAVHDLVGDRADDAGQPRVGLALGQQLEGPQQGHPGPQQIGDLAVGGGEMARGDPSGQTRPVTDLTDPNGREVPALQLGEHRPLGGGRKPSVDPLPGGIARNVGKGRHGG